MGRCCRRRRRGGGCFCYAPLIVICFGGGLFLSYICSFRLIIFLSGLALIILGLYTIRS